MTELEEMVSKATVTVFRSDSGATVKIVKVRKAVRSPGDVVRQAERWTVWIEGGVFLNRGRDGGQAFFETWAEAYRAGMATPYPARQTRTYLLPKLTGHRVGGGYDFGLSKRLCVAFLAGTAVWAAGCTGTRPGANLAAGWGAAWFSLAISLAAVVAWGLCTWSVGRLCQPLGDDGEEPPTPCTCGDDWDAMIDSVDFGPPTCRCRANRAARHNPPGPG